LGLTTRVVQVDYETNRYSVPYGYRDRSLVLLVVATIIVLPIALPLLLTGISVTF